MTAWLRLVVGIALMRDGPQDLPASATALITALVLWWLLVVPMLLLAPEPLAFGVAVLTCAIQLGLIHFVLFMQRRAARFLQTAQALFATGALIGLLNLPLWWAPAPPIPAPLVVLAMIGLFWSLAVDGHVWRHALELPYAGGLAVAVLVFLLQIVALDFIGMAS